MADVVWIYAYLLSKEERLLRENSNRPSSCFLLQGSKEKHSSKSLSLSLSTPFSLSLSLSFPLPPSLPPTRSHLTFAGGFLALGFAAALLVAAALLAAAVFPPLPGDFGGGGALVGALVAAAALEGDFGGGLNV